MNDGETRPIRLAAVLYLLQNETDATVFIPPDLIDFDEIKNLQTDKLLLLPNNKYGHEGQFRPIRKLEYSISFRQIDVGGSLANALISTTWDRGVWDLSELTLHNVQGTWVVTGKRSVGAT